MGLGEQGERLFRIPQIALGLAERQFHPRQDERVSRGLALDVRRRSGDALLQNRSQSPALFLGSLRVDVLKDHAKDLVHLRHLAQPLLGMLALLGLGNPGFILLEGFRYGDALLPPGLDESPSRPAAPPTSERRTRDAASTWTRCRRTNFRTR